MPDLRDVYRRVRRSVVAFIPRAVPVKRPGARPSFFPIVGTGFVVGSDGILATNHHVLELASKLPRPPGSPPGEWPFVGLMFAECERGFVEVPLDVIGLVTIEDMMPGQAYYGPKRPDIGLVRVRRRGLPALDIDAEMLIEEGVELATAGFPMGTAALTAPGWLHQLCPTLQKGIVSSVMPFPCKAPHAFTLNVMVQGGASGSPVFHPETGAVHGVVYGSLMDATKTDGGDFVELPTNISYAVPAHLLQALVKNASAKLPEPPPDTPDLDGDLERALREGDYQELTPESEFSISSTTKMRVRQRE